MLSKRAKHLLKILVNRYIYEGQPIGSCTLSKDNSMFSFSISLEMRIGSMFPYD